MHQHGARRHEFRVHSYAKRPSIVAHHLIENRKCSKNRAIDSACFCMLLPQARWTGANRLAQRKPRAPDAVKKRERELRDFDKPAGIEMPRGLKELEKLRGVACSEAKALRRYRDGHSPFEARHAVIGVEFENVLVVVGRGWNPYNFGETQELAGVQAIPAAKQETVE